MCLATNVQYTILGAQIKHIVARLAGPRKPAQIWDHKNSPTRRLASLGFQDTVQCIPVAASLLEAMETMTSV
jgi:hypothetical protein